MKRVIVGLIGGLLFLAGSCFAGTDETAKIKQDAYNLLVGKELSKASFGMRIDEAKEKGNLISVKTTGAIFVLDKEKKTISITQRIPKKRNTVQLTFNDSIGWESLCIRDKDTGAVWLGTKDDRFILRINCDSLLMFSSKEPTRLKAKLQFKPINFTSYADRYLFLDNYGGVGLYPLTLSTYTWGGNSQVRNETLLDKSHINKEGVLSYNLSEGEIFWVSVAPPKPFNWKKRPSDKHNIVWYQWYANCGAPKDEQIKSWRKWGDWFLLHSDGSWWKGGWQKGGVPFWYEPPDEKEYRRVIKTAHKQGMKVIVYAAPIYFVKGVIKEGTGKKDYHDKGIPNYGTMVGENFSLYYDEVKNLKDKYGIDGVYFDEVYPPNTVRAYIAVRKIRELFGEKGVIIEHHDQTFHNVTCPPSLLSWYNAQIAGEAFERYWNNRTYLRYAASTYNIANCNDYLCVNTGRYCRLMGKKEHLDDALLQKCLDYNIYQFYAAYWEQDWLRHYFENFFAPFWKKYVSLNMSGQQKRVETVCAQENSRPKTTWQNFLKGLSGEEKLTPSENLSLDESVKIKGEEGKESRINLNNNWSVYLGPKSNGEISVEKDGSVHITANANTCAYLEYPLKPGVKAIQCRLKTSENGGEMYGVGMALRWTDKSPFEKEKGFYPHFHMALTQEGNLEVVHMRVGAVAVKGFRLGEWYTLRYRFLGDYVISEVKLEDGSWRPVEIMLVPSSPTSVVIGKVETVGRDIDAGGGMSECWVDNVKIYR